MTCALLFAAQALAAPVDDGTFAFARPVFVDEYRVFDREPEGYRQLLTAGARAAGLPVLGVESLELGMDRSDEAVWLVTSRFAVTCFPLAGYLRSGHARCAAEVHWEVVDRATGKAHFAATTSAAAERVAGEPPDRLAQALIADTSGLLFVRGPFRAALAASPPPPASIPLRPCADPPAALPEASAAALAAGFTSFGATPLAGVLLSSDGLGLVPVAAVGSASTVAVRLPSGLELPAVVLRRDPSLGLALLDVVGEHHRCRAPAVERQPEVGFVLTATAAGHLVLIDGASGADEPGALALTRDGALAGAAGRPWRDVADALGIGSVGEPVEGGAPAEAPPGDLPVMAVRAPVWTLAERRATRGLLVTAGGLVAGALVTWAAGQGATAPVTGSPLVVANTHLWAGALVVGAVGGVQVAQAMSAP